MKGIILAGGVGTRLYPISKAISKQLIPVYDKPMIYYPLSTLMLAGIRDILIITTPQSKSLFQNLLNDGSQWGIRLFYKEQSSPDGIAQAFLLGKDFIGSDDVCLILGDNLFYGHGLSGILQRTRQNLKQATIFAYYVENPKDYGVIEFAEDGTPTSIIEKPQMPQSHYVVTGLYFYNHSVVNVAQSIKPSARGELEISDINQYYLNQSQLKVEIFPRGITWLDTGTARAILYASQFIEVLENRQGLKIACLEEIAWRRGYINTEQLTMLAQSFQKSTYGKYLQQLLQEHKLSSLLNGQSRTNVVQVEEYEPMG